MTPAGVLWLDYSISIPPGFGLGKEGAMEVKEAYQRLGGAKLTGSLSPLNPSLPNRGTPKCPRRCSRSAGLRLPARVEFKLDFRGVRRGKERAGNLRFRP